jgi:hypothetical protein
MFLLKAICKAKALVQLTMYYSLQMKYKQELSVLRLLATCGNCSCIKGCENKPEVKPDILILGKQFQEVYIRFCRIGK